MFLSKLGPLLSLILVWAFFASLCPDTFPTRENSVVMLAQTAVVGTAALGMTMIIISGGIDLSVGSGIALCTVVVALLLPHRIVVDGKSMTTAGVGPWTAALGGIAVCAFYGLLTGLLITRARLMPFIVTLGTFGALRGAAKGICDQKTVFAVNTWLNNLLTLPRQPKGLVVHWSIPAVLALAVFAAAIFSRRVLNRGGEPGSARSAGAPIDRARTLVGVMGGLFAAGAVVFLFLIRLPIGVWIMLGLAVLVSAMLRYTRFGRHIFAIGSNEQTARLCGVRVERTKILIYTLGAVFAGIAGVLQYSFVSGGDPTTAKGYELSVIAAVVIGGASLSGGQGSILGSLIGAMIMTVIDNGCSKFGLDNWVQEIATGGIIILAVALDQLRHRRT